MRAHLLLALSAALSLVVAEPADLEVRVVATTKTTSTTAKTTSTTAKTTSTTAKTTSTTSTTKTTTAALTTSTSVAAAAVTGPVPTSLALTLNAQQSTTVRLASSQIVQAALKPQCAISGGRILSAYYQTNQSSLTVASQCGALCKSQILCNSYAIEAGFCRLYIIPVISVLQTNIPGNNTFYDRGCATSTNMCAVNGFRLPFDKSFSNSTKIPDLTFNGCSKLCKAASGCSAFSLQMGNGGVCQLYKRALYQNFVPDASIDNIFWDVSCSATVAGAANAPPTLTPYVPNVVVPASTFEPAVTFPAFTAPTPLSINDPAYVATAPQPSPDDDNIFTMTYTYTEFPLPPVSVTGTAPVTTGLVQPSGSALPSAPCMVSTGPSAAFSVINENYFPMVASAGTVGPMPLPTKAPAAGDPILSPETLQLPGFYFQAVSGASNIYDMVYSASGQYVAMHKNGSVLLTGASTGIAFANNVATSIFTWDCLGRINITQGGASYNWVTNGAVSSFVKGSPLPNMKALPINNLAIFNAKKNRRENLKRAEQLQKRSYSDGPAPKCPATPANLVPLTKEGYVQDQGNFCDNLSDDWGLSPYDFDGSCAVQSACYDSCEDFTWVGCNAVFGTLMIASCWADCDEWWDIPSAIACTAQASYFTGVAATQTGRDLFYKAQGAMCRCFCSSPPDTCAYSETDFYCADLHHGMDNDNCGACGQICGPNSRCRDGGYCGCPLDQCGSTCLDFRNNPQNCGACGNVCSSGYCLGGSCYTPHPGQCAPDQGVTNNQFEVWEPNLVNWTLAAYPGCTLGSQVNFEPTAYTGANGQTIDAMLVEMTSLPGGGCSSAVTSIQAKMCDFATYELTFVMGAVGQVNNQNVVDDADCSIYWATGPPNAPGQNGNYQTSPTYTIQGGSSTFQTFGPWGPFSISAGDPGVSFHHGNYYINLTAVITCGANGGHSSYFILGDVELNAVGSKKDKKRETISADAFSLDARDSGNSTGFNISQALNTPYVPPSGGAVVKSSLLAQNVTQKFML